MAEIGMIAWFLKKVKGWYCNRVQARIRDAASVVSFGILGGRRTLK